MNKHKHNTYDLIEAMVIVLLIGILIGGFITHFSSYNNYQECVQANKEYSKLIKG